MMIMFKILFFMRNYESSRQLINLLWRCMRDIGSFLSFLIWWVFFFTLCQVILGVDYDS